jgi:hypothetical protein
VQRGEQMGGFQGAGKEPVLPQVAYAPMLPVLFQRVL